MEFVGNTDIGRKIADFTESINQKIESMALDHDPNELYEPIRYMLELGGKRMRPVLALLAYDLFRDDANKIIEPAIGIELFHNFTLLHDDIMDNAPLRRGNPAVHKKWNQNIAILSGDTMFIKAYQCFQNIEPHLLPDVLRAFNDCALQVCEGQQRDMNFENEPMVSVNDYLFMIQQKTAVLLGFSLELGAILAEQDIDNRNALKQFGLNIGTGFQLKDDYLDVYADQSKFGKVVGGDIIANKKTFMLITALEIAGNDQKNELNEWLSKSDFDPAKKVDAVKNIFNQLEIPKITESKMNEFSSMAFDNLDKIDADSERIFPIRKFAEKLMLREQ